MTLKFIDIVSKGICVVKVKVSFTIAQFHSDIKISNLFHTKNHSVICNQVLYVLCLLYTRPNYKKEGAVAQW